MNYPIIATTTSRAPRNLKQFLQDLYGSSELAAWHSSPTLQHVKHVKN